MDGEAMLTLELPMGLDVPGTGSAPVVAIGAAAPSGGTDAELVSGIAGGKATAEVTGAEVIASDGDVTGSAVDITGFSAVPSFDADEISCLGAKTAAGVLVTMAVSAVSTGASVTISAAESVDIAGGASEAMAEAASTARAEVASVP